MAFTHNEAEHSRLNNLIIRNVPEAEVQDGQVMKFVFEFFNEQILKKIPANEIPFGLFDREVELVPFDISTAHRMHGNPNSRRTGNPAHPIIVAFTRLAIRNVIWKNKRFLKEFHAMRKEQNKSMIFLDEHHEPLYDRKLRYLHGIFLDLKPQNVPVILYPTRPNPQLKIHQAMYNVNTIPARFLNGR